MKKIVLLLPILVVLLTSCDSSTPEPLDTKQNINITISKDDWKKSTDQNGLNPYYYCSYSFPEITSTIKNSGSVIVYIEVENNKQAPLPYIRHYESIQGTTHYYWTTTLDYDFKNGELNFYYTNSDFASVPPDGDMYVRVLLMW